MGDLGSIIRDLGQMVGAVAVDSIATGASTAQIADNELQDAADRWKFKRAYIWAGTGEGQERPIVSSAAGLLSFSPAWTTQPTTDSNYLIFDEGWDAAKLRRALVMAIRDRRRSFMLPKIDESVTLDMDPTATYEYDIPSGFISIQSILREHSAGDGNFDTLLDKSLWYVNKAATRKLVFYKDLDDSLGLLVDGCKLRITGQQYQTEPTDDTDTISIDTGLLLQAAAVYAHMMRAPHDQNDSDHHMTIAQTMNNLLNQNAWDNVSPIWPDSVMVEDI